MAETGTEDETAPLVAGEAVAAAPTAAPTAAPPAAPPAAPVAAPVTIVLGRQFEDPALAAKVTKVRNVAIAMAVLVVVDAALSLIAFFTSPEVEGHSTFVKNSPANERAAVGSAVAKIVLGLLIPICGYCGARNGDRCAVFCFACMSWVCCILSILAFAAAVTTALFVAGVIQLALPEGIKASFPLQPMWYDAVGAVIYFANLVLGILAGIWGCSLYHHPQMYVLESVEVAANTNDLTHETKAQP